MPRRNFGRPSLFSKRFGVKIRNDVVSITLAKRHHTMLRRATKRLKLTRSDVITLLIERYAATVSLPD